jgi:hypothetical protein
MKKITIFIAFILLSFMSNFGFSHTEIIDGSASNEDKIFYGKYGGYFIIRDDVPCDSAYLEREDGSGYELLYSDC